LTFEINVESLELTVKLEKKRHIKHCYLRVLSKDMIQIRSNIFFTKQDAKNLIIKKSKWILSQIQKLEEKSLNEDEFIKTIQAFLWANDIPPNSVNWMKLLKGEYIPAPEETEE